jgi:DNA-directed RNA polymerase specialized sigma24 family protein
MNWQELSDRKLVELCVASKEDAWAEFLRRFRPLIMRVASRTLQRVGISVTIIPLEDMLEESLVRIIDNDYRALRELKWLHEGALYGLLQITSETATKDRIRSVLSEKRDPRQEKPISDLVVEPSNPVDESYRIEQKIFLDQLVSCLKKVIHHEPDCIRDVTIFLLFYSQRVTAADLARVYKMNLRKVENNLARLARLAKAHCL